MLAVEVSSSAGIVRARDNVRYLGQFGEHILCESFTARDPKPTFHGARRSDTDDADRYCRRLRFFSWLTFGLVAARATDVEELFLFR